MRVDVRDLVRGGTRLLQRLLDGTGRARTLGVVAGDVVRVGGDAAAHQVGVDLRAAGLGVLLGLEDQRRAALAHDEAVAVDGAGTGGGGRVVVAAGQGLRRGEGRHGDRVDRGLRATGDDHVGETVLQVVVGVRDRLRAGGARADDRAREGLGVEVQRQVPRTGVGHQHRNRQRHDTARSLLAQRVPGVQQRPDAADARGPVDAETLGSDLGRTGVLPGLAGGDHRELRRGVEALGLVTGEHLLRADGRLGGEVHGDLVLLDPVVLQRARSGLACEQIGPVLWGRAAQSGRGADTGDDDALGHEGPS